MENTKYVLTYGDAFVDYIAANTKNDAFNRQAFERASVFHFCSGTLFHPEARATTRKALKLSKNMAASVHVMSISVRCAGKVKSFAAKPYSDFCLWGTSSS